MRATVGEPQGDAREGGAEGSGTQTRDHERRQRGRQWARSVLANTKSNPPQDTAGRTERSEIASRQAAPLGCAAGEAAKQPEGARGKFRFLPGEISRARAWESRAERDSQPKAARSGAEGERREAARSNSAAAVLARKGAGGWKRPV